MNLATETSKFNIILVINFNPELNKAFTLKRHRL